MRTVIRYLDGVTGLVRDSARIQGRRDRGGNRSLNSRQTSILQKRITVIIIIIIVVLEGIDINEIETSRIVTGGRANVGAGRRRYDFAQTPSIALTGGVAIGCVSSGTAQRQPTQPRHHREPKAIWHHHHHRFSRRLLNWLLDRNKPANAVRDKIIPFFLNRWIPKPCFHGKNPHTSKYTTGIQICARGTQTVAVLSN